MTREDKLDVEIQEAADKAIDSLARYKFAMFGYWAGIWVHLNRIEGRKRENPFRFLVHQARTVGSLRKASHNVPAHWRTAVEKAEAAGGTS